MTVIIKFKSGNIHACDAPKAFLRVLNGDLIINGDNYSDSVLQVWFNDFLVYENFDE